MVKENEEKNITAGPKLKTVPPTTEAFRENVLRAYIQTAIWKSAPDPYPPSLDPTKNGWVRDEATQTHTPRTLSLDVAVAPTKVLELLGCGCSTDEPCDLKGVVVIQDTYTVHFFCACCQGQTVKNTDFRGCQ